MTTTGSRLTVLGALTGLTLTSLAFVAPAAEAAWTPWVRVHGAHSQVCKVPLGGGRLTIKIRLNNSGAGHAHRATLDRTRDGRSATVEVRAAAGRVSGVKSLAYNPGDWLGVTLHEPDGGAAGGDLVPSAIRRC